MAGAVFEVAGDSLVLEEFAVEALGCALATDAAWDGQVARALASLAAKLRVVDATVLGLPGHLVLTKHVTATAVAPGLRGKVIPFEASQAIPHPLHEVVWDHAVVADDGHELRFDSPPSSVRPSSGFMPPRSRRGCGCRQRFPQVTLRWQPFSSDFPGWIRRRCWWTSERERPRS